MAVEYDLLRVAEADRIPSGKSGTDHVDLTDGLSLAEMRARVWYVEPGNDRMTYHRHENQEELYYVLRGPGRMEIGEETIDVPEGAAVRVPPETPRRIVNDTDDEHVWLVVGAPPVPHDGQGVPRDAE